MDTAEREDRHSLNGTDSRDSFIRRKKPTAREKIFANKVYKGKKAVDAYMEVYEANSKDYASRRAALLLKTKRVETLMNENEQLRDVFLAKEVDLEYLIGKAKDMVDNGKNDGTILIALKMLWDAYGVIPKKQTVTEIAGVFQGFTPEQIESAKRRELPAPGEVNG